MPHVSISIHHNDPEPYAYVLGQGTKDGPFVTVCFGGVSVYVRGYGRESSASARAIAASLVKAADDVDAFMDEGDQRIAERTATIAGQEVS